MADGQEPAGVQRRRWQDTCPAHPGRYGEGPPDPAVRATAAFRLRRRVPAAQARGIQEPGRAAVRRAQGRRAARNGTSRRLSGG
ncbi:hypothetical protein GCM10010394_22200 [Streptomyces crystallinus]|uniref:Uncharacterized protein n=1 Tax=Streptomyces crystallinus TaxID=68191 RepID=A0ABP3QN38_9ACTN